MSKQKRVGLYARISTNDGRQDAEVQLSKLREYCGQRDFKIVREYVDEMTGSRDDRPEFMAMMDDARKRKLDAVIVFRFDRFSRSTKTLVDALEEFQELGVDFVSYMENIDTSTPMGKAMFTICSAFSEMERSVIRERVSAGLSRAREKGIILGRPRKGFDMAEALRLKAEGLGVRKIGKRLGVSHVTIHRYLKGVTKTFSAEEPVGVT